jgi:hypothetical protein
MRSSQIKCDDLKHRSTQHTHMRVSALHIDAHLLQHQHIINEYIFISQERKKNWPL